MVCAILTLAKLRHVLLLLWFLRSSRGALPKQQPFMNEDFRILPQAIKNSSYITMLSAHAQASSPGQHARLRYTLPYGIKFQIRRAAHLPWRLPCMPPVCPGKSTS